MPGLNGQKYNQANHVSLKHLGDENLLFRGNSFATKAMDYYMKMVGEEVLTIKSLI